MVCSGEIEAYIEAHICEDVRQLALAKSELKGEELRCALTQIELRQRMIDKLPRMAGTRGVWFGSRLATEQCSSERCAAYKKKVLGRRCKKGVDLTGGMGVDTIALAEMCEKITYVERDEALCAAAKHNFALLAGNIEVRQTTAEEWLYDGDEIYDFGFIDPARRNANGGKVFRIKECTPDISGLRERLLRRCRMVMVKLSPMLDVKECIAELRPSRVVIVSADNECKELIAVMGREETECCVKAVELRKDDDIEMQFRYSEEEACPVRYAERVEQGMMLYEPFAAMMKSGAWRLMGERYGARMIAANSHLYVGSDDAMPCGMFPGRRFRIVEVREFGRRDAARMIGAQANVAVRNFPMSVAEVRRRFKCRDGGERYIFLTTSNDGRRLIIDSRKI